ncbi:hypothetical protein Gohar_001216 [Gossypium harknessii]|uniref:Uncharacterized protein n=2 Tax=Gossypium TaxID=3633 RepID=A0A7J9I3U9_9ROSI|nr:hypothetical protein [Gossypium harknessii]
MTVVVGKDMTTESFARTFADIDLDDGNQDLVPVDYDNEEVEEVNTFDDDFPYSVFDYLMGHESETKVFLAKYTKHRKIWLQKLSQGSRY